MCTRRPIWWIHISKYCFVAFIWYMRNSVFVFETENKINKTFVPYHTFIYENIQMWLWLLLSWWCTYNIIHYTSTSSSQNHPHSLFMWIKFYCILFFAVVLALCCFHNSVHNSKKKKQLTTQNRNKCIYNKQRYHFAFTLTRTYILYICIRETLFKFKR